MFPLGDIEWRDNRTRVERSYQEQGENEKNSNPSDTKPTHSCPFFTLSFHTPDFPRKHLAHILAKALTQQIYEHSHTTPNFLSLFHQNGFCIYVWQEKDKETEKV